MFSSLDQVEKFKKYLSSKHPDINFSLEKENEGRLSFLDINIFREKGKFVTNVYRKRTFSGVYINFDSFIPETYKTGLIQIQIRTRINRVMRNKLPHCNLRIVFQTKCKLINFFTFKDKIPVFLRSGIVY